MPICKILSPLFPLEKKKRKEIFLPFVLSLRDHYKVCACFTSKVTLQTLYVAVQKPLAVTR